MTRHTALRRLAYEAFDSGLLSPELVAGIRRVKGGNRDWFGLKPYFGSVPLFRLLEFDRMARRVNSTRAD